VADNVITSLRIVLLNLEEQYTISDTRLVLYFKILKTTHVWGNVKV